jgi:hypothetical protein
MKDEYKGQSSPVGTQSVSPLRHGEADDFASGRALAYEWRRLFREASWVTVAIPAATAREGDVSQGM